MGLPAGLNLKLCAAADAPLPDSDHAFVFIDIADAQLKYKTSDGVVHSILDPTSVTYKSFVVSGAGPYPVDYTAKAFVIFALDGFVQNPNDFDTTGNPDVVLKSPNLNPADYQTLLVVYLK